MGQSPTKSIVGTFLSLFHPFLSLSLAAAPGLSHTSVGASLYPHAVSRCPRHLGLRRRGLRLPLPGPLRQGPPRISEAGRPHGGPRLPLHAIDGSRISVGLRLRVKEGSRPPPWSSTCNTGRGTSHRPSSVELPASPLSSASRGRPHLLGEDLPRGFTLTDLLVQLTISSTIYLLRVPLWMVIGSKFWGYNDSIRESTKDILYG